MNKLITRTIQKTDITVIGMDTETAEVSNKTFTVAGIVSQPKAFKIAQKMSEGTSYVPAKVVDISTSEKLYGITETDFLKYAQELDSKTRKPIGETSEG